MPAEACACCRIVLPIPDGKAAVDLSDGRCVLALDAEQLLDRAFSSTMTSASTASASSGYTMAPPTASAWKSSTN